MVLMIRTAWPEGVCDVACDYLSVVEKLEAQTTENRFDAVILDLRMPGMRGRAADAASRSFADAAPNRWRWRWFSR